MFHATDIKERFQAEKDFNSTTEVIGVIIFFSLKIYSSFNKL
jgi:hypothetical protein